MVGYSRRIRAGPFVAMVLLGLVLGSGAARAQVAPLFTIPPGTPASVTVDEFGVGAWTPPTGGGSLPLPLNGPDIGPGAIPGALTYVLPVPAGALTVGDLLLMDPLTNQWSDVIRFNPNGTLVFYSDFDPSDPPEAPADVGMPTAYWPVVLGPFPEFGPEGGPNGVDYTPGPGMPGFDASGSVVVYHLISDVPEPASLVLLLAGGLLLFRSRRSA